MSASLTLHEAQELALGVDTYLEVDGDRMTADLWQQHPDGSRSLLTQGIPL